MNKKSRFFFFNLPRPIRFMMYLPVITIAFFLLLRQLEFLVTYHPVRYSPGARWTPPANGEDVWFKVASGERVHGWFLRTPQSRAIATLLYCHGNGGNLTDVGWIAEEMARRGFDAMVFDYRGYGRSDGKLTGEWAIYADTEAAYEYLLRDRGAIADRLVIYGQSLGSTAAIDLASRRPCAALIVESGLSSASEMGAIAFPWLPRWLHFLGKNRFESARKIANVNCPVFITHGTKDSVIPVAQGRRLYDSAREPKRLMIVEGGDHNLAGGGGEAYMNSITDFIREAIRR